MALEKIAKRKTSRLAHHSSNFVSLGQPGKSFFCIPWFSNLCNKLYHFFCHKPPQCFLVKLTLLSIFVFFFNICTFTRHMNIELCVSFFLRLFFLAGCTTESWHNTKQKPLTIYVLVVRIKMLLLLDLLRGCQTFILMLVLKIWWQIKTSFTIHVATDFYIQLSWLNCTVMFYEEIDCG